MYFGKGRITDKDAYLLGQHRRYCGRSSGKSGFEPGVQPLADFESTYPDVFASRLSLLAIVMTVLGGVRVAADDSVIRTAYLRSRWTGMQ